MAPRRTPTSVVHAEVAVTRVRATPKLEARIRELLNGSGLRSTPARQAVLRQLSRKGRPLSHGEIAAAGATTGLDRVTLYRTLAKLQDAGLVHRVQDHKGAWRFCAHVRLASGCPGNHAHFQCTRCGLMRCLADQSLPWITLPDSSLVLGKQLLVYGLCPACTPASTERRR